MQNLINDIRECKRCKIEAQTEHKTIGKGSMSPKVLFVGLNPGKEENKTGTPFIGKSGKLLDKWIQFLDISTDCAVVNLVKCYSLNQAGLKGDEVDNCYPFLEQQIAILKPDYIVALGDIVFKKLTNSKMTISEAEGKFFDNVFVMRHPSFFLRRGGVGWQSALQQLKDVVSPEVTQEYVPLHCHSEHSVTDGAGVLDELVEHVSKEGFKAMALTDHGTIGGWYDFNQSCIKHGVKPIFGIEFYVTTDYEVKTKNRFHLIALAKNDKGIKNLFKLNTIANVEGFYFKPRITLEDIYKHKEGLIISSACTLGVISSRVLSGDIDEAYSIAMELKAEFGEDFYLEFQPHSAYPEQLVTHASLIRMVEELEIEPILTCDVHYRHRKLKSVHNAIRAIAFNGKYGDYRLSGNTYCILSGDDISQSALETNLKKDLVERALENTVKIADKCTATFPEYDAVIPKFKIPEV